MNKRSIIGIMIFFLITFTLTKVIFSQLCEPAYNNPIASMASSAISGARPSSPSSPDSLDPLSWEPLLKQLVIFFAKACPR
jgi:hypothetical protein